MNDVGKKMTTISHFLKYNYFKIWYNWFLMDYFMKKLIIISELFNFKK